MTTLNDIEDLARILETQPHWVSTLRTRLLSEELLALPQTVAQLAATVRELTETVQQSQRGQAELTVSVQEATGRTGTTQRVPVGTGAGRPGATGWTGTTQRVARALNARQLELANAVQELQAGQERLNASQSELARAVQELQAGQERLNASQERLNARQLELANAVQELQAGQERLNASQSELAQAIQRLQEGHTRLEARQNHMETLLGHLVGSDLEARLHRRIRPLVSQRLQLRQTSIKQSNLLEPDDAFFNEVATAFNNGVITPEQEQRISDTDFIMRARRTGSNDPVWVVAEAASRLDASDITRARDSAEALAAIYGAEVIPVVIGYRIDEVDDTRAAAAGVRVIIIQPAYLP